MPSLSIFRSLERQQLKAVDVSSSNDLIALVANPALIKKSVILLLILLPDDPNF